MSGGRFNYQDSALRDEIFGWRDYHREDSVIPNIFEDREISELIYDVFDLIHSFDWYQSGDTGKEDYLEDKIAFKKKWLDNRGVRVKRIVDESIKEVKRELYETYNLDDKPT